MITAGLPESNTDAMRLNACSILDWRSSAGAPFLFLRDLVTDLVRIIIYDVPIYLTGCLSVDGKLTFGTCLIRCVFDRNFPTNSVKLRVPREIFYGEIGDDVSDDVLASWVRAGPCFYS